MEQLGMLFNSITRLLPTDVQKEIIDNLKISETSDASPAGAILIGMHILESLGFTKYIDDILGVEHTTITQLKDHYNNRAVFEPPMMPSLGIFISLLVADMIACPSTISPQNDEYDRSRSLKTYKRSCFP